MPPTDASTDAASAPLTDGSPGPGEDKDPPQDTDAEDTLDLRLPTEFIAFLAGQEPEGDRPEPAAAPRLTPVPPASADLLDQVGDWGPTDTPAGAFQLVPVRVERDLPLLGRWMNDPAVAAFWELDGTQDLTEKHLNAQLAGDGRSVPCLGVLDGTPISYWEIYRADLDSLARHYPARPHDTGIHILIGDIARRGRGLGGILLRSVADLVLDKRPACARVVAEPDIRNTPSVAAFLSAGFRFAAEADLPAKRAALMVRDRSLRHLL
ncbi:GNAT family N-acetyltransferase [Streptomyces sp. NPDC059861]|uniref:GNAT family N-acetyltransferase n=1 Tax=Streptomyces sp. NPDC059861 TaxID=3346974 RepID=UPI0036630461